MIDRRFRDEAASLTRAWRDGLISNYELAERWPSSEDRALAAVESMLWRTYDDHRVHLLDKVTPELFAELTRYADFLDTDLEYEWSEDRFDTIDWLAAANAVTLGLVPFFARRLQRREATRRSEGDPQVWPFARAADMS